jgi:hypothetical protein
MPQYGTHAILPHCYEGEYVISNRGSQFLSKEHAQLSHRTCGMQGRIRWPFLSLVYQTTSSSPEGTVFFRVFFFVILGTGSINWRANNRLPDLARHAS